MRGELIPRLWSHELPRSLFREFADLDRSLEAFWDGVFGEARSAWWPSIESYVKDGTLIVRSDLPGVDPGDLDVSVAGDTLTIRGERRAAHDADDRGYVAREVRYGKFERRVSLPEGVDPDKITARYTNGVLEVTLPLPSTAAPRKVPIEVEREASRKAA